jgi:tetratricopeptide (TPR) repeat protein
MPFTINGIGTRYAGMSSASARLGPCEFCRRQTTLTSYDTREFFCILYIPLIPLAKYRILGECASCRKHRRAPAAVFRAGLDAELGPLRERVLRSPRDAEAQEALTRALIAWGLTDEADSCARSAVLEMPDNVQLNCLAGQIALTSGDDVAAARYLTRAVELAPSNANARLSLGRTLYLQQRWSEAIIQLAEARRLGNDAATPILLAQSYEQLSRWQEALDIWQGLASASPTKELLRRTAYCRKQLGHPLSDAERRASRKWWPFRRDAVAKIKPTGPAKVGGGTSKIVLYGGSFIAVVMVLAFGTLAYFHITEADVWFDSIKPRTTFRVDGETFTMDAGPVMRALKYGDHTVLVTDRDGRKLDERTIHVARPGWFDTLTGNRAFVYNTAGMRVYERATIIYSTSPSSEPPPEYLAGEAFFPVDGIDYFFSEPPQTIELSSSTSSETKHGLAIARGVTLVEYANEQSYEGQVERASQLLEQALAFDACDEAAREHLVATLRTMNRKDSALTIAKKGTRDCGSVVSHRLYQNVWRAAGFRDAVQAEYETLSTSHPESAMYHYLLGRAENDRVASEREFREAARLDQSFAWAHVGLAYVDLGNGRYEEAMSEFATAIEGKCPADGLLSSYAGSAIAAGRADDARRFIDTVAKPSSSEDAWLAQFNLHLGTSQWDAAKTMHAKRTKDGISFVSWYAGARMYALSGDDASLVPYIEAAEKEKDLAPMALYVSIQRLLTRGKYDAAGLALDKQGEILGSGASLLGLYTAAGLQMNHDARAARRLDMTRKRIDASADLESQFTLRLLADCLDSSVDETAILEEVRREDMNHLKDAWFLLAARAQTKGDVAHAKQLFRNSAETSFDLDFPLAFARTLGRL